jgi:hypothetical protein
LNNKEKSLPFRRLGMTRKSSRKNRGRREINHPFSEIVLKDNCLLESPGRLKWVGKCQGCHLWNVGVVKKTIGTWIAPTEMIK